MSRRRNPELPKNSTSLRIAVDALEKDMVLSSSEKDLIRAFRNTRDRQQIEMLRMLFAIAEAFPRTPEPKLRLVVGGEI